MALGVVGTILAVVAGLAAAGAAIFLYLASGDHHDANDKAHRAIGANINRVETSLGDEIKRVETSLGDEIKRVETSLGDEINRVETSLRSEMQRGFSDLSAQIASLAGPTGDDESGP